LHLIVLHRPARNRVCQRTVRGAFFTLKGKDAYKDWKQGVTVTIAEHNAGNFRIQVFN